MRVSRGMIVLALVSVPLTLSAGGVTAFRVYQDLCQADLAAYDTGDAVAWDRVATDMPQVTSWLEGGGITTPVVDGVAWTQDALGRSDLLGVAATSGGSGLSTVVVGGSALDALMGESLADIGTLTRSYADGTSVTWTPVARLTLPASAEAFTTFDWPVMAEEVATTRPLVTREHAQRGEWNRECGPGEFPEGTEGVDWYTVGVGVNDAGKTVRRCYVTGEADEAEARLRVERRAWRSWLADLLLGARELAPDAADRIERATSSCIIARCSWPVDGTRDVIVCVAE